MGQKGRLEMWGGDPYTHMIVRDIEQGAKLAVVEHGKIGPRFGCYRPHPGVSDAALALLREAA
jgi:hypothetical protein